MNENNCFLISTDSNTISYKYNNNKKENNNIDSYNLKTPKKINNKNVENKRDKTHLNRLKNKRELFQNIIERNN